MLLPVPELSTWPMTRPRFSICELLTRKPSLSPILWPRLPAAEKQSAAWTRHQSGGADGHYAAHGTSDSAIRMGLDQKEDQEGGEKGVIPCFGIWSQSVICA